MTESKINSRKLAVAIIARNEQDVLVETIQSVKSLADEILVLDTGSSDRTPEIASALGAQVLATTWKNDFSAARNELLEQISADWVLWLDAGERLDPAFEASLREFIDEKTEPDRVYLLPLELPAVTPQGLAEQVLLPRLVPGRKNLPFVGRVRESQSEAFQAAGLQFDVAPGRLLCPPRRHDTNRKVRIAERNLDIVEQERASASGATSARLLLAAADAHASLDRHEQAADHYLQAIRSARPKSLEMLEGYYGLMSSLDRDPSQLDRQITMGVESLESFPLDAQLLCLVGSCLRRKGCNDLAIRSFQMASKHGEVVLEAWHVVDLAEITTVHWALALRLNGQFTEAADVLDESLETNPNSLRLIKHRFDLALQLGQRETTLALIDRLYSDADDKPTLREAVHGVCDAAENNTSQALGRLQAAYARGCREPFALRGLAVVLLTVGQTDVAQVVLAEWAKVDPNNAELRAYAFGVERPLGTRSADRIASRRVLQGGTGPKGQPRKDRIRDGKHRRSTGNARRRRQHDLLPLRSARAARPGQRKHYDLAIARDGDVLRHLQHGSTGQEVLSYASDFSATDCKTVPIVAIIFVRSIGLLRYSSHPASRHFARSSCMAFAVKAMIGR